MTSEGSSPVSQWGSLASWGDRVVATLIDALIGLVIGIAVYIVAFLVGSISDALGAMVLLLGQLVSLAYAWGLLGWLEGTRGQSPGKALMGLKVVSDNNGQTIGGAQGIVRRIAHIIDSIVCFIGYLLPLFDAKRQTIADKLLTTVVLRDQPRLPFGLELFTPPELESP